MAALKFAAGRLLAQVAWSWSTRLPLSSAAMATKRVVAMLLFRATPYLQLQLHHWICGGRFYMHCISRCNHCRRLGIMRWFSMIDLGQVDYLVLTFSGESSAIVVTVGHIVRLQVSLLIRWFLELSGRDCLHFLILIFDIIFANWTLLLSFLVLTLLRNILKIAIFFLSSLSILTLRLGSKFNAFSFNFLTSPRRRSCEIKSRILLTWGLAWGLGTHFFLVSLFKQVPSCWTLHFRRHHRSTISRGSYNFARRAILGHQVFLADRATVAYII